MESTHGVIGFDKKSSLSSSRKTRENVTAFRGCSPDMLCELLGFKSTRLNKQFTEFAGSILIKE